MADFAKYDVTQPPTFPAIYHHSAKTRCHYSSAGNSASLLTFHTHGKKQKLFAGNDFQGENAEKLSKSA